MPQTPPEAAAQPGVGHARTGPVPTRWVVGVDGSPGARAALVWALGAAARAGAELELVSTFWADFSWMDPLLVDTRRLDEIAEDTRARVHGFLTEVRADPAVAAVPGAAEVGVEVVAAAGAPAERLVARAADAQRLVVGSRGRGGVRSTLLGSVALHCVAHAPCPVVVVHPGAVQHPPRVVVGIDDSAMSRAALESAAEEARRTGAQLEIIAVYQPEAYWSEVQAMALPPIAEAREQVRRRAEEVIAEVLGAGTPTRLRVEDGAPADVLIRVADGAALLVVGSHSRSRIAGTLLGSVALHCVVHAPCPVMIVHPQRARAAAQSVEEPAAAVAR
ncbi:universal stress protein [Blastococcus sp. SYSU DS1024]